MLKCWGCWQFETTSGFHITRSPEHFSHKPPRTHLRYPTLDAKKKTPNQQTTSAKWCPLPSSPSCSLTHGRTTGPLSAASLGPGKWPEWCPGSGYCPSTPQHSSRANERGAAPRRRPRAYGEGACMACCRGHACRLCGRCGRGMSASSRALTGRQGRLRGASLRRWTSFWSWCKMFLASRTPV